MWGVSVWEALIVVSQKWSFPTALSMIVGKTIVRKLETDFLGQKLQAYVDNPHLEGGQFACSVPLYFHLLKNLLYFPLLVLKGIYHYWKYILFQGA